MLLLLCVVFLVAVQDGSCLYQREYCMMYANRPPGKCTPPAECRIAYSDPRYIPSHCTSKSGFEICCSNRTTPNGAPIFEREAGDERRLSERKCAEYDNCARSLVSSYNLSGKMVLPLEFPHMAAIGFLNATNDYVFLCGGSLISPRFVLTAGHCSKSTNRLLLDPVPKIVRLGDFNLVPQESSHTDPINVPIKAIHKHPEYKPPSKYHDIALFELNEDLEFNRAFYPACLWTKPDFPGYTEAIATGWGATDPKHPTENSNMLMKVSLTLLENEFCNQLVGLQQILNRNWQGFTDGQLCAGELVRKRDTCKGDSGGPLQLSVNGSCNLHVIGVTSHGQYCGKNGEPLPAVYTRVSSYLDWIESVVWPGEQ